jgi:hypothetical protein
MSLDGHPARGTSRVTQGPGWLAIVTAVGLTASFGQRLHADELQVYATKCDAAIGATVPAFRCHDGTEVPVKKLNGDKCDRPDRLNSKCYGGGRVKVLTRSADAYIVALCRSEGSQGASYNDIGVIQYSRRNGATCFYQKLNDHFSGDVTAPSEGLGKAGSFEPPHDTAEKGCVDCHDNGPFIRSPYLTQITGNDRLPEMTNKSELYAFVGAEFATWSAYKVEVVQNKCVTCHRLGVARRGDNGYTNKNRGTALDFSIRSTAASETSKNPTSADSPLWMPPIPGNRAFDSAKDGFDKANADAAAAIRACAEHVSDKQLPNTDQCRITPLAKAFTGQ